MRAAALPGSGLCLVCSRGLNWREPETGALSGDEAAAFVVGPAETPGQGIVHARLATYAAGADHCRIEGDSSALHASAHHKENRARFHFQMDGLAIQRALLLGTSAGFSMGALLLPY